MTMHTEYKISGTSVFFPCKPYPSQFSMMDKIIKGLERRQNCLLESPTGSGKSLALLCSSLAWQSFEKEKKDKEEDEEVLNSACLCVCHTHEKSRCEEPTTQNDNEGHGKESLTVSDFDDDDFKSDGTKFNIPSLKKSSLKHISLSYDDDNPRDRSLNEVSMTAQGITIKKFEEKSSPQCQSCKQCSCDGSEKKIKIKTKIPKIYFCTRTHKQMAQIVKELRKTKYKDVKMTVLGSREHTCIHPEVSRTKGKNDSCKDLLNGPGCRFKDGTQRLLSQNIIKSMGLDSAWDIEDIVNLCQKKKACPYFLSRGLKDEADLVICPYNYLIDPIIREAMAINLKGHIVILDEAHNIEDTAREAASQSLTQENIEKALKDIDILIEKNVNFADNSRLRAVFHMLNKFIEDNKSKLEQKDFEKAYKLWSAFDIVAQLENLGLGPKQFPALKAAFASVKAEAEQRKEEAYKSSLNMEVFEMKPSTEGLLTQIFQVLEYLYRSDLKYVEDYRVSLVQSYEYVNTNTNQWLNAKKGPNNSRTATLAHTLHFWCMNPGVAFSDFSETHSIILTSGTLSPLTSFQSELGLNFSIQLEANHVIRDSQVWVGTIGTGPSGSKLQAVFRNLETFAFQDELGGLVLRVCEIVPHGVLCFLPSYKVLEKLISRWENIGLLKKLACKKKIIIEPRGSDKVDFEEQMLSFYETLKSANVDSCGEDGATGAVFFAVCRGKVSEGLDFADNFARAVITVGIPYPNFKDVQVEQKRQYNESHKLSRGLLGGNQWYEIQAFRALNQALGRCIRHRNDWGALIIVDERFNREPQKYCSGLSKWVRTKVQAHHDFSAAMGSLQQFISARLAADNETSVNNKVMEFSETGTQSLPTCSTIVSPGPLTATPAVKLEAEKANFSIFNTNGIKRQKHDTEALKKINKDVTAKNSGISRSSCFNFKFNLNDSAEGADSCKVSGACMEDPIIIKCDDFVGASVADTKHLHSENTSNHNAIGHLDTGHQEDNKVNYHIFQETNDFLGKPVLKIITEIATNEENLTVVKIPDSLRPLFGGDIRIPLSRKQALVYSVQPPASVGQKPVARLVKMSEEEKHSLLAAIRIKGKSDAINRDTLYAEQNTPAKPEVCVSSTEDFTPQKNITFKRTLLFKRNTPSLHSRAAFMLSSPSVSTTVITSPVNSAITSENILSSPRPTKGLHDAHSDSLFNSSTSSRSDASIVMDTPPSTSTAMHQELIVRNKKRLFKSHNSPTGSRARHKEVTSPVSRQTNINELKYFISTPRISSLTSKDLDEENFEEDKIVVRRRTRKRKISDKKQKNKEGNDCALSKQNAGSGVEFKCSSCSHVLLSDKSLSDFSHQSLPVFLKEVLSTTENIGCYFFPSNTNLEGLCTRKHSDSGKQSKYVEQEEICIQFLYCKHCSQEKSDFIGGQVQLTTAAGTRFSKGQLWLLENFVQLMHQNTSNRCIL